MCYFTITYGLESVKMLKFYLLTLFQVVCGLSNCFVSSDRFCFVRILTKQNTTYPLTELLAAPDEIKTQSGLKYASLHNLLYFNETGLSGAAGLLSPLVVGWFLSCTLEAVKRRTHDPDCHFAFCICRNINVM